MVTPQRWKGSRIVSCDPFALLKHLVLALDDLGLDNRSLTGSLAKHGDQLFPETPSGNWFSSNQLHVFIRLGRFSPNRKASVHLHFGDGNTRASRMHRSVK